MSGSAGHSNRMDTASTMGLLAEAPGTTVPGTAGLPAPDSRLLEASHAAGRRVVEMVGQDRRPSQVLTAGSFRNAIVALAAIGGASHAPGAPPPPPPGPGGAPPPPHLAKIRSPPPPPLGPPPRRRGPVRG